MMNSQVLLGRGRELIPVPWSQFQQHLAAAPDHHRARLGFMSDAHHQVRYFVVAELLRGGVPVGPAAIAERLEMPRARVEAILADLEHNLFFLVRDEAGSVRWAFPVTAEPTPHRVHFRSGEAIYAA